jgi:signal transduction histidine kinase
LQAADTLNPKQKNQLQRVQRASQEMRELIHTFLQLARDNLDNETEASKATIGNMAQEQYEQWKAIAEGKQLQLLLVKDIEPPAAHYNIALLRAVVSNLLRNAIHYTDSGTIRLVLTSNGFKVEDSGVAIEASQRESIFQPFVRGTGARGEGLGLGLSLVKRICIHQGWSIQLYSLPAGGNCFEVSLN